MNYCQYCIIHTKRERETKKAGDKKGTQAGQVFYYLNKILWPQNISLRCLNFRPSGIWDNLPTLAPLQELRLNVTLGGAYSLLRLFQPLLPPMDSSLILCPFTFRQVPLFCRASLIRKPVWFFCQAFPSSLLKGRLSESPFWDPLTAVAKWSHAWGSLSLSSFLQERRWTRIIFLWFTNA